MTKYHPLTVAKGFVGKAGAEGDSHMKLQKLIYLTLEDWLRSNDETFLTEGPEVWPYGPVFPTLYHQLKNYRSNQIRPAEAVFSRAPIISDKAVIRAMDRVWDEYGSRPATDLSDLTHRPGSPWHTVAQSYNFSVPFGTKIPRSIIKRYVRKQAKAVA